MIQVGIGGLALCGLGVLILVRIKPKSKDRKVTYRLCDWDLIGLGLAIVGLLITGYVLIGLLPPGG